MPDLSWHFATRGRCIFPYGHSACLPGGFINDLLRSLIVHTHSHEALCERIKAHCQQKQWYGPDIDYLFRHASHHLDESSKDHDFRSDFMTPATEEQIRLSEERMGISFPPLLRMLYLRVADGGFGPGCGLRGIFSPGYGLWGAINWHHPTFPKTTFG